MCSARSNACEVSKNTAYTENYGLQSTKQFASIKMGIGRYYVQP